VNCFLGFIVAVSTVIQMSTLFVQCGVKGVNMPYNPSFADETYSYEYGGYVDPKRRGGSGGRGRGFHGRSSTGGFGGR